MILLKFCGGYINTGKYLELRSENGNRDEIESLSMKKDFTQEDADKLQGLVLESETKELERIFGAQCFQFKLEDVQ
jgi:hypothetical protein